MTYNAATSVDQTSNTDRENVWEQMKTNIAEMSWPGLVLDTLQWLAPIPTAMLLLDRGVCGTRRSWGGGVRSY